MEEVIDIVKGIVAKMDLTIRITSIDAINGNKLYTCDTKFIKKGYILSDPNGKFFRVQLYRKDEYIIVEQFSGVSYTKGLLTIRTPEVKVLSGTPLTTNTEYSNLGNVPNDRFPLIWLLEPYTAIEKDKFSSVEQEMSCTLFFLDDSSEVVTSKEHHDQVVKRMIALKDLFIDSINNDFMFKNLEQFPVKPRVRFGRQSERGSEKKILDDLLSGIELNISLEKFKSNCKC